MARTGDRPGGDRPSRVAAAQLPLYTLWSTGTPRAIGFALIHCTGGDVLITTATLSAAAMLARPWRWPVFGGRMALAAILF